MTKHFFVDYVIVFIYFNDEKNNKLIKNKIVKEIYLINELKINMLIDNDFIKLKKIKINVINFFVCINNCEITIFLNVKTFRKIVHTSIYVQKIIIISFYFEIIILFYYNIILKNKDFLFKLKAFNFFFYAYLINVNCKSILVRNNKFFLNIKCFDRILSRFKELSILKFVIYVKYFIIYCKISITK